LKYGRWHSSIPDVWYFRGADCITDHYLVTEKVTKILSARKQEAQTFEVQRFNLKKLMELEVREQSDSNLKQVCSLDELK
jgi:hypothetical protein